MLYFIGSSWTLKEGGIRDGGIEEGRCEGNILCLSLILDTFKVTVPHKVALLNPPVKYSITITVFARCFFWLLLDKRKTGLNSMIKSVLTRNTTRKKCCRIVTYSELGRCLDRTTPLVFRRSFTLCSAII
jgi:hypothetical protein